MTETDPQNPKSWSVEGNLIPKNIGSPTSTSPFTGVNAVITIETAVTIDGKSLIPVKVTPSW